MLKIASAILSVLLITGCTKLPPSIDDRKIQLTAEEQQYVDTHRVVTWALEDNRPPFSSVNDNGEPEGISIIYLNLISRKTGIVFKPMLVKNFNESFTAVSTGKIDIITAIRPSPERAVYLNFSVPYVYNAGVFLFRMNSQPQSPLRAGISQGDAVSNYLAFRFPDMKINETEDSEEAISLLEKGLIDVVVMNEASADYLASKSFIRMRKAAADFDYPFSFGVKKDNVILIGILSKALDSISVDDKKTINDSWKR